MGSQFPPQAPALLTQPTYTCELLLDYAKMAEGSGLSINKVRKAVKWLIDKKEIEARKVFGNKRRVKLPADTIPKPGDLKPYISGELPTESYPHTSAKEDPTEY
jgi:hypothetical protein